mgnify:FL=1
MDKSAPLILNIECRHIYLANDNSGAITIAQSPLSPLKIGNMEHKKYAITNNSRIVKKYDNEL